MNICVFFFFDVTKAKFDFTQKRIRDVEKRNNKDKLFLKKCVLFPAKKSVKLMLSSLS